MNRGGRLGVLAVDSPDPALSALASLGLGAAAGTALVVDVAGTLDCGSARTLIDMADAGPSLRELSPGRSGIAVISGGGIDLSVAKEILGDLAEGWPAIVVQCAGGTWPGPTVPVRALYPGLLRARSEVPSVWQPVWGVTEAPGPGPILPPLRRSTVRHLLSGRIPPADRWMRAWRGVWSMPWA